MSPIIFSLNEIIDEMFIRLNEYNNKVIAPFKVDASKHIVKELIVLAVNDRLSDGLKWCKRTHTFSNRISELAPWFEAKGLDEATELFDDSFVEHIYSKMIFINDFIGQNPWDVILSKVVGNDIIVTNVGDYRIMDWERRMASGEWEM